jgi:hypothetical protein
VQLGELLLDPGVGELRQGLAAVRLDGGPELAHGAVGSWFEPMFGEYGNTMPADMTSVTVGRDSQSASSPGCPSTRKRQEGPAALDSGCSRTLGLGQVDPSTGEPASGAPGTSNGRRAEFDRLPRSLGADIHDRPPRFAEPEQLSALLRHGRGFGDVVVMEEEFSLLSPTSTSGGNGVVARLRRVLDALSEADLARYAAEAAEELGRAARSKREPRCSSPAEPSSDHLNERFMP